MTFRKLLSPAIILAVLGVPMWADTLHLKDGRSVVGTFVSGSATQVRFRAEGKIQAYRINEVVSVMFGDATAASVTGTMGSVAAGTTTAQANVEVQAEPGNATAALPSTAVNQSTSAQISARPSPPSSPPSSLPSVSPSTTVGISQQAGAPGSTPMSGAPTTTAGISRSPSMGTPPPPLTSRDTLSQQSVAGATGTFTVPADTRLTVRMTDTINSETAKVGDRFRGSLDQDWVVNGTVVAAKGTEVVGSLVEISEPGVTASRRQMTLELSDINIGSQPLSLIGGMGVTASPGASTTPPARLASGGAIAGPVIGGAAGGERSATVGAGVGAGAAVASQVLTRGETVRVPSQTVLEFRLQSPLVITNFTPVTKPLVP